ncbi:MAG: hypothetical protein V3S69_01145, partial [Dehalococcoidales bacterium]
FFKKVFESSTDKMMGREVDAFKLVESLKMLSPVDIGSLPPSISAGLGYYTNTDYWQNEDIWKKTDKPLSYPNSREEHDANTPQAMKDFGAITGLSPDRSQYAIEQLVTRGTVWSYMAGQGYDILFEDLPESQRQQHLAEVMSKVPMVKRFMGVTNPYSKFAEDVDKAREADVIPRFVQNRGLDKLVNGYLFHGNTKRKEVDKYINSFKDPDVQDRLLDRFEFSEAIKEIPNRSFWLAMRGIPSAQARARLYVEMLEKSSEDTRLELQKGMAIIEDAGGVISEAFIDEVLRLRRPIL